MTADVPDEPDLVLRSQLPMTRAYAAPRTPTEQSVCEIWRAVLTMDRVGVDDSYHDLGGDSFLATVIFEWIQTDLGVTLPMALFAQADTVAALAREIDVILAARM
jgi:acyl carrier protein